MFGEVAGVETAARGFDEVTETVFDFRADDEGAEVGLEGNSGVLEHDVSSVGILSCGRCRMGFGRAGGLGVSGLLCRA